MVHHLISNHPITGKKKLIGHIAAVVVFIVFVFVVFTYFNFNPASLKNLPFLTTIYDRTGQTLQTYQDREIVSFERVTLDQLPTTCKQALVATEDKSFYQNVGIDLNGMAREVINFFNPSATGGSTISQQVVKISNQDFFNRGILTKFAEAIQAVRLNSVLSKDEILTIYANNVSLGNGIYGLGAGAKMYFDKPIGMLSLAECSFLAGLPQLPAVFNPSADLIAGTDRQHTVLESMQRDNYITQDQLTAAENTELSFSNTVREIRAPHFTKYVLDNLPANIASTAADVSLLTTYDYTSHIKNTISLQQAFNGTDLNASLIVLTNDGKIENMIGSTDYFSSKFDGSINKTLDLIQPAQTLAPFLTTPSMDERLANLKALHLIDDHTATRCDEQLVSHNCETTLLDLANAYRAAFGGSYTAPQSLTSADSENKSLTLPDVVSSEVPASTLSGLSTMSGFSYITATPSNKREVILIAHNDKVTIGLWAGRNNNSEIDTKVAASKLMSVLTNIQY